MIDTAGTIVSAAELLRDRGAAEVWIAATHGVLVRPGRRPAQERARSREVVVTNTLPIPTRSASTRCTVLSIAPIVAEALDAVFDDATVSEIFRGDNV